MAQLYYSVTFPDHAVIVQLTEGRALCCGQTRKFLQFQSSTRQYREKDMRLSVIKVRCTILVIIICLFCSSMHHCNCELSVCLEYYILGSILIRINVYVGGICFYMVVLVLSRHQPCCHEVSFVRQPCVSCVSFKPDTYLSVYPLRSPYTSCQR